MPDIRIGMVAHDMRSPLAGTLGFLNLLATTPLTEEQRGCLDTAVLCLKELEIVLDGLVEDAVGGGDAPREEWTDVEDLLRRVTAPFELEAREMGLGFQLSVETPARMRVDRRRVTRVLWNLLGNAVKFTPAGGVSVRAALCKEPPEAGWVCITVADTGSGIPAGHHERVFKLFERGGREHGGAGLGLAIVRELVAELGGSLRMRSEAGVGTEMEVRLPLGGNA